MGLMDGKKGIIFGVSNKFGIANAIAEQLHAQGAEIAFTYANEAMEKRVRPIAESMNAKLCLECDVTKDEDVKRVCKLAQADDFVMQFPDGYNTHIEEGGTNVSGGQKQRLCIARALLKHPKVLILDDSTSAVDTKTDSLVQTAFKTEIPDTTKIIIAQRISSIENCDKIVIMDNGQIDGIGTHEELLKNNEIYKEVFESQTQEKGSDTNE